MALSEDQRTFTDSSGSSSNGIGDVAVCTVVSKNYLAYARVLAESLAKHHPDVRLFVLLVDRIDGYFQPEAESFTLLTAEDLPNIAALPSFLFKYTILELNTAVKPFLFEHLFDKYGLRKLLYFDPDILINSSLETIWDLLDSHSAVVTPHILQPIEDTCKLSEAEILQAGSFNLGFLGMARTETMDDFLRWWQKRLYDFCIVDHARGYFVDQKWVDLAPGLFGGFHVLRDRRYNVAYWNFHERGRDVTLSAGGELLLSREPLGFFHFSGFNSEKLEAISKHQTRFTLSDLPNLRPVYEMYRDRLAAQGHEETRKWPYAYASFDNGVRIPDFARQVYREKSSFVTRFPEPFQTQTPGSYYQWLTGPVKVSRKVSSPQLPVLPRFWREVYREAPDLHLVFPDAFGASYPAFYEWVRTSGKTYLLDVDAVFLPQEPTEQDGDSIAAAPPPPPAAGSSIAAAPRERVPRSIRRTVGAPLKILLRKNPKLLDRLHFWAIGLQQWDPRTAIRRPLPGARAVSMVSAREEGETQDWGRGLPFGVNVSGYLAGEFGIGQATRGLVHALRAASLPLALNNIVVSNKRYEDKTFGEFTEENPYSINLLAVNADMVTHTAAEKGPEWFADRYNIGVWYWELSEFPASLTDAFAPFHEIWVTSAFCAEAIAKVSPVPVVKITYPVHLNEAAVHASRDHFKMPDDQFAFVFSFDFHSYVERKNPFAVVEAFRQAFGDSKEALLVLKSINGEQYPEKLAMMREAARGLNVRIIDSYFTHAETLRLFATCDCLVSLHRSEGLGLGMAEAMYLGKPVIATAYSGNMEFMNVNNSLPVRYKLVELEQDYGPYTKGNVWAEPDVDHAAAQMRLLFEDRDAAAQIGKRAAQDIRLLHDPKLAGQQMRARLERIASF